MMHPATQKRAKVEALVHQRIGACIEAAVLLQKGAANVEYKKRKDDELTQALQQLKDACYDEATAGPVDSTAAHPAARFHICTCGDCDSEAFADRCKFEVALRALVDDATEFHSAHVVSSELIAMSKSLLEADRG